VFRRVVACRTGLGHPGGNRHEDSPHESQTSVASRLAAGFLRRRRFFMIGGALAGWMVIAFTRCPAIASPGEPEQPRYR